MTSRISCNLYSVIAIDHGTLRTGFAVADPLRITTQALGQFEGADESALFDFIATLLEERTVGVFVLGMPYNMDGTEGPRAKEVREFGERLAARFKRVKIAYQDERLSTKAAEELLKEAGHFGEHRKARKDSMSAVVILRDWVEAGEPLP